MKVGHYLIKYNGLIVPARWDGFVFNHEFGTSTFNEIVPHSLWQKIRNWLGFSVQPIAMSCPTGCVCTFNPDGTTNVDCHPR